MMTGQHPQYKQSCITHTWWLFLAKKRQENRTTHLAMLLHAIYEQLFQESMTIVPALSGRFLFACWNITMVTCCNTSHRKMPSFMDGVKNALIKHKKGDHSQGSHKPMYIKFPDFFLTCHWPKQLIPWLKVQLCGYLRALCSCGVVVSSLASHTGEWQPRWPWGRHAGSSDSYLKWRSTPTITVRSDCSKQELGFTKPKSLRQQSISYCSYILVHSLHVPSIHRHLFNNYYCVQIAHTLHLSFLLGILIL